MRVNVIYFGKRGSGGQISQDLYISASRRFDSRYFSKSTIKHSRLIFLTGLWPLKLRKIVIDELKQQSHSVVIFPMSSVYDIFLGRKFMKMGHRVVRLIHDFEPHLGESWPTASLIRAFANDCDRVVCLSSFVAKKLHKTSPTLSISVVPHPYYLNIPDKAVLSKWKKENQDRCTILLIGRGQRYKGAQLLIDSARFIKHSDFKIRVVGKGFKFNSNDNNYEQVDEWISEEQFIKEIASARLVVLPYLEASQSGIIPLAIQVGTPVVVTPVGGLPSQIAHGENGLVCNSTSEKDLATTIDEALSRNWVMHDVDVRASQDELLDACMRHQRHSFECIDFRIASNLEENDR